MKRMSGITVQATSSGRFPSMFVGWGFFFLLYRNTKYTMAPMSPIRTRVEIPTINKNVVST
jgi:hypothetical protein